MMLWVVFCLIQIHSTKSIFKIPMQKHRAKRNDDAKDHKKEILCVHFLPNSDHLGRIESHK